MYKLYVNYNCKYIKVLNEKKSNHKKLPVKEVERWIKNITSKSHLHVRRFTYMVLND